MSGNVGAPTRRSLLAAGLLLPLLALARAAAASDEAPEAQEALRLLPGAQEQGRMRLRWFGLPIYDARLWTRQPVTAAGYAQQEFVLGLRYVRALEGAAIAERSLQEMQRQQPLADAQAQAWLAQMRLAFPDVQPGDRLLGWHRPGRESAFFLNGRATHAVTDAGFAGFGERFFGIWLSPRSRDAAQRDALLGLAR